MATDPERRLDDEPDKDWQRFDANLGRLSLMSAGTSMLGVVGLAGIWESDWNLVAKVLTSIPTGGLATYGLLTGLLVMEGAMSPRENDQPDGQ